MWVPGATSVGGASAVAWMVVDAATRVSNDVIVETLPPADLAEFCPVTPRGRLRQIRPFPPVEVAVTLSPWGQPSQPQAPREIQYVLAVGDRAPRGELWALSDQVQAEIQLNWGRPSVVVPLGVESLLPETDGPREAMVVRLGRFTEASVRAVETFCATAPPAWRLVLLGAVTTQAEGDRFNACGAWADQANTPDRPLRVQLIPNVSYPVVCDYLRRAAVVWPDPEAVTGLAVLQAQAAGCGVVTDMTRLTDALCVPTPQTVRSLADFRAQVGALLTGGV